MPSVPNIHRQLGVSGENLNINRFWSGEVTQRSPLFTPLSQMGLQIIARVDTLYKGGHDMEISPEMTLVRRYGFSKFSTAQFGASDHPLNFYSFKNISGTINLVVDTPTEVAAFTPTALTSLYSKGTTVQTSFQKVGSMLYMADGTNQKKWDGTTVSQWGIVAPVTAPTLSFSITGNTTSASNIITNLQTTSGLFVGEAVSGSGIPAGATVSSIDSATQIHISVNATATATGVALSFGNSLTTQSGYQYVYVYRNAGTTHISTASPNSANTGPFTSGSVTVGGVYSTDTQVTNVDIYRIEDGGSLYYFLATITNNSAGGNFYYVDTTTDTGLNTDLVAPVADANDPPPATLDLVTWHQDRLVGAAGNILYFSAGPDTTNGVGEESWPAANAFRLPDKITALVSTTSGLLVFTASDLYVMLGTDTVTFWVKPIQRNFGVLSQNCVAQDGGVVFVYTSRSQLFQIDASSEDEIGFNVGDQLASTFNPANSYLTVHRNGTEVALWISDGSANLKGYGFRFNSWYPTAQPVGGIGAIKSIETSTGTWSLLMGRPAGSGFILKRDTTLYTDDGTPYTCAGVVGSLVVSPLGELSKLGMILVAAASVGTYPTVSVLINEISGTFTPLPNPVNEPPIFDKTTMASTSLSQKRHYFKAAAKPLPAQVQHLQVQFSFPAENFRAEIYGMAVQ